MRIKITLLALLLSMLMFGTTLAQQMSLVYEVEHTGADYPKPTMHGINDLPTVTNLPDPFEWSDGRGRISNFSDWRLRRAEIKAEIEHYEIGEKPLRPDSIQANYSASTDTTGTLTVVVTKNGRTLTLNSQIALPKGSGPFPAVIGMNSPSGSIPSSIFSSRNIARITFSHNQVTTYNNPQNTDPYYQLYSHLNVDNTGQYSAWAWGVSRIIDGLELVQGDLPIDVKHLAVSGCSYAGKMAIFAGAFDERIALTFGIESGGGGATSWRYSGSEPSGTVEGLSQTSHQWFKEAMFQFGGANVSKLPEDHNELLAMCAPRALFVTANMDFLWLSNPSSHVCSKATQPVYDALGIADRFGFYIDGGHGHCAIPGGQIPAIEAFVEKFLLGNDTVSTNVATTPYTTDLAPWITWITPTLSNDTALINWAVLSYPSDQQSGVDTVVTFQWKKGKDIEKYYIQVSTDPTFNTVDKSDSTTTDSSKALAGLSKGTRYYWRVKVQGAAGVDLWSNAWSFITTAPLPAKPDFGLVSPVFPTRADYFRFQWNKVQYAEQYIIQVSTDQTFATIFKTATVTDTVASISGHTKGVLYYWRVQPIGFYGAGAWSDAWSFTANTTGVKEEEGIPAEYSIGQNYPNPFNPSTTIKFALPQSAFTTIIIYDLLGREIQTLINKKLEAGYHEVNFDAHNYQSGVYFYKIQSGTYSQTRKMVLMK